MKQCIEYVRSARWSEEALAHAQFHLALLYREQGIEPEETEVLQTAARRVLERYQEYAPPCVRDSGDELMVLDDLQPTFLGRWTGRSLLKCLQKQADKERAEGKIDEKGFPLHEMQQQLYQEQVV